MPMEINSNNFSNIEKFLLRSEQVQKNRFYVLLPSSIICLAGLLIVLLTEEPGHYNLCFIVIIGVLIILGQVSLWYCYHRTKQNRQYYQKMLQEHQDEMNAPIA